MRRIAPIALSASVVLFVCVSQPGCKRRAAAPPATDAAVRVPPRSVPADEVAAMRAKLSKMVAADQHARRNRLPSAAIDQENTAALKEIVRRYVWPTISVFGRGADRDAWLLAQHADHDRAFQKQVLAILESLTATGETAASNYAYLHDRVAVAEAEIVVDGGRVTPARDAAWPRRQRYGTQGACVGTRWEPYPLEDPARVDELRKSVGLGPIEEYRRVFACR